MARLIWLSRLGDSRADLQHYFGHWAMEIGEWDVAEQQLSEAAGSLPTRAAFAADLALSRAQRELQRRGTATPDALDTAERARITSPALRALQAMAGTFSLTHDASVCDTVAEVYLILGTPRTSRWPRSSPRSAGRSMPRSRPNRCLHQGLRTQCAAPGREARRRQIGP